MHALAVHGARRQQPGAAGTVAADTLGDSPKDEERKKLAEVAAEVDPDVIAPATQERYEGTEREPRAEATTKADALLEEPPWGRNAQDLVHRRMALEDGRGPG